MSKIKFEELSVGSVIESKKKGELFEVVDIQDDRKAQLKNLTTSETATLSASTLERWYVVSEFEKVVEEVEEAKPKKAGPVISRPARRGRTLPKAKIEEEITEQETKPEEVEEIKSVSEKDVKKPTRKPAPKKESHMALTKKLESSIQEMFPASRRVVTGSYVAYAVNRQFVTIEENTKGILVGVRAKGLSKDQISRLTKVAPKKYGWAVDGFYRIRTEEDIDTALEFISASHLSAL